MSGLSFSTHSPALTLRTTERHLAHAKRKLYQFVLREIDRVGQSSFRSNIDHVLQSECESCASFLALPLDILLRAMYVMDPTGTSFLLRLSLTVICVNGRGESFVGGVAT